MTPEEALEREGMTLPVAHPVVANYAKTVRVGSLLFVAGHGPEHHLVANGATDLLVKVFGDIGRPARSAVGMASLPLNFAVEIEAVVEIHM